MKVPSAPLNLERGSSAARVRNEMVNNLLEYARTELSGKMPVSPNLGDMDDIFQASVEEMQAVNSECDLELQCLAKMIGNFDGPR